MAALLQKRGLELIALPAYPGLLIKEGYWHWPQQDAAGNAIDFHTQVLGLSFHDAMRQITSP